MEIIECQNRGGARNSSTPEGPILNQRGQDHASLMISSFEGRKNYF